MDVVALLVAANLVLTIVAVVAVFTRKTPGSPGGFQSDLQLHRDELRASMATNQQVLESRLTSSGEKQLEEFRAQREENQKSRIEVNERLDAALTKIENRVGDLTDATARRQTELQKTLAQEMEKLRTGNEEKLEKMRETVDEKLQGTLEKRLGESFKFVSDRLEKVHEGLGQMQELATGVGDLKKMMSNVKNRGGWGEVQLESQLSDMLSPEQFERNVHTNPDSAEAVEFAVKMPGREEGDHVYLPIDSKFPQEDYERLLTAQEAGDLPGAEAAGKALEKAIRAQAKTISDKYIFPPKTTDFAIMYLPTEGLYAEVVRRGKLAQELQRNYRVMATGPTTLMALLNSLQLGFRTLAIEKRTSEVWQVLSAAKTEFGKYGQVWDKLAKQLGAAQNTVQTAGVRTRAVERALKRVETLEVPGAAADILAIEDYVDDYEGLLGDSDTETDVGDEDPDTSADDRE